MYNLKVNTGLTKYDVNNAGPAGSTQSMEIYGQGEIRFNDIGDRPLGPNKQTWGVCITFRDQVWVYRYEANNGTLSITWDEPRKELKFDPQHGSTIAKLA